MISFHISDNTITFFARRKTWSVASDNPHFKDIKIGLLTATADEDQLIEWTDVRVAFTAAGNGKITIEGNEVLYKGRPIHNVWVEKLFSFRNESLPFDAPLLALESLMQNPSATARERLPIFVERNKLGFLPDGRIVGLKVVRSNFHDCHSGRFDNHPGQKHEMERSDCDDNWENACSSGFHIGAYEYLPNYGLYDSDKHVVLCAFAACDAVAVPKDYRGSKLRVSKYEVLSEIDKDHIEEYLATHATLIEDFEEVNDPCDGSYDDGDDD